MYVVLIAHTLSMTLRRDTPLKPVRLGFVHRLNGAPIVGAAQSGTVGFFNPNVINLDGKIDSDAGYSIYHDGIRQCIDREHIEVLVDWPDIFRTFLFAGLDEESSSLWKLCDEQPTGVSRCYVRAPLRPRYSRP